MKKILPACFFWAVVLPAVVFAAEKLEFRFDARPWKAGYEISRGNQSITEYVLEGETVQNWNELVTVQFFGGLQAKTTVDGFIREAEKTIRARCPDLQWKILNQTQTSVLYEWSVESCAGVEDQNEVARTVMGKEGIHVLHYAVKKDGFDSGKMETWKKLLSEAGFPGETKPAQTQDSIYWETGAEVKTFKLKSGAEITGKILLERELYYQVEQNDGTRKLVFKRDLASESS